MISTSKRRRLNMNKAPRRTTPDYDTPVNATEPSKPPPVRRAGVSVVPLGQCLRGKSSEELRKRSGVLEPGLKVAGAGLDNSTWVEAIRREPRQRGLVEIVGGAATMLT